MTGFRTILGAIEGEPIRVADAVDGTDGWSPIFAGEADGTRTLLRVVDWSGGGGVKPAAGMYLGSDGYTTRALAFNFNPSQVERQRVQVTAGGTLAVAFARVFPPGVSAIVQLTVEAPAGSPVRYTAQLDGPAGNDGCTIKALRDNTTTLGSTIGALLGLVLFAPAPGVWVHVQIAPPPIA